MNKKSKPLGGGVHQLNNNQLFNLQLFADPLNYSKVNNPYNFYLNKHTWAKGDIKVIYNLEYYYKKIPDYDSITTLPEENANYIKEALPNVTSCEQMMGHYFLLFGQGCKKLTSIDTTGWDTSNITSMNSMFSSCNALTTLDVSKFNTSKVTDMSYMFSDCRELTTLDISNWDTSNVTNMDNMFSVYFREMKLTTITGVIDMKSCTSYNSMFHNCPNLTGVKIKNPPSGFNGGGLSSSQYTIVS